jgi:hypothetical protein
MRLGRSPTPFRQNPAVVLLSILCPHCNTPLARVPRCTTAGDLVATEDVAACLACGMFGDYRVLTDQGVLTGGVLSAQEIEDFCAELGGLRDQAARAEATDRGD